MKYHTLNCNYCQKDYSISTKDLASRKNKKLVNCFCSRECRGKFQTKEHTVSKPCGQCNVLVTRRLKEYLGSRTGLIFCNSSCSAKYSNTHKTTGTRISKLENWLSTELTRLYPNLEIHYNRKDAVDSELDIYIPSLKLGFELNGIFHYQPIYGQEKLEQTILNDARKLNSCINNNITLFIINTSNQKRFTEKSSVQFLDTILEQISSKLESGGKKGH